MWNKISKQHKIAKTSWNILATIRSKKQYIGPLHEEGKITTDIEITEILNNHFSSIFISENLNNVPDFNLTYFRINEKEINIWK